MAQTFGELIGAEIRERREAAAMTQRVLACESFPDTTPDSAERRVREIEAGTFANPRAKTYQPLCDTLNISRSEIRAMKEAASDTRAQKDAEREEFEEASGSILTALAHPEGLSRAQLIFLSELFEHPQPEAHSDATLRQFLTQKAEEYRSYKTLIDGLDERVAAIANLKGAAQDAAERLDFEEVETLLARVDVVETTIAAETKEARASNALLRNRPEQAYAILSDAADSFRALGVMRFAGRRNRYPALLYNHGLRYGGPGLRLAADMIRPAIGSLENTTYQIERATCTQNLAVALQTQGTRTAGAEGTDLLAEAVAAYRDALTVRTRADQPVQWAMTQENLAIAEFARAEHPATDDPEPHLRAALVLVERALEVYDPDHLPYYHEKATLLRDDLRARLG